ncbi:hypothetical protein E4U43_002107 [Claviceps pusilla]|uniref:Uncharacterized protein n=1 Tax=Claviceps pusilla TaxID=123648 RepID=A0A9P7SYL4_9HYPO|nr:hypothetical protein E4U43_002107 [Claviceps pusilla]
MHPSANAHGPFALNGKTPSSSVITATAFAAAAGSDATRQHHSKTAKAEKRLQEGKGSSCCCTSRLNILKPGTLPGSMESSNPPIQFGRPGPGGPSTPGRDLLAVFNDVSVPARSRLPATFGSFGCNLLSASLFRPAWVQSTLHPWGGRLLLGEAQQPAAGLITLDWTGRAPKGQV